MRLLIKNIRAITFSERGIVENAAIIIENGRITWIGEERELKEEEKFNEVLDGKGRVALPGFINAHSHLYSSLARGMPISVSPHSFREILEGIWWRLDRALDEEDVYLSALVGIIDAVRCGTTSIIDHHASPNFIKGSLDLIEKAAREVGIRTVLCYEVTDRNGKEGALQGIEENVRFARKVKDDDMVKASFGLHASFTLSSETLALAREAESELDIGFHIHVAEGIEDLEDSLKNYGMRTVERLDKEGILKEKSLFIHTVNVDEREIDIMKERGVKVVHNPSSNMNNAVGYPPLLRMLEKGICVGLGTDGYTQDILGEMRQAIILMRHCERNPSIGYSEVYRLFFENNPRILKQFFGTDFGRLDVGYAGDVILVDYTNPTPMSQENIMGHLVFGFRPLLVRDVVVNGRVILRDGEFLGIDENSVLERARSRAEIIWRRL